ncbi:MAG: ATPase domain-containing protein [Halobacteria archaeon]|nr:ATPase domain-containing protein [Halobacteria archaeon]
MSFLTANPDSSSLFVNLSQSEEALREDAEKFGFDLGNVTILDLSPSQDEFGEEQYSIFSPGEVETGDYTQRIIDELEERNPDRVVIDPLTQFRYLSQDTYQFNKLVLSFFGYLKQIDSTVLFTSQKTQQRPDDDLQYLSDAIISLGYSDEGRTVEVTKYRGSNFRSGSHSMRIDDDGMTVFPRLDLISETRDSLTGEKVSSGVPEVDTLLGGGIEKGTVTIISGPSGVGKTTSGAQFMKEAAGRGEKAVIYMFEERRASFLHRAEAINMPVREMVENGNLKLREIEAMETTPDEFANLVKTDVEDGAEFVMIDGVTGYKRMMTRSNKRTGLVDEIHTLGRFLSNRDVTTFLISEVKDVTGDFKATAEHVSYIADNIVFLRYLEMRGEMRKSIGVLKKRAGSFERTLREFMITEYGIKVGEPLTGLRGILTGTPEFVSHDELDLLNSPHGGDGDTRQ